MPVPCRSPCPSEETPSRSPPAVVPRTWAPREPLGMRNQRLGEATSEWTEDEARTALALWRQSGDTIAAYARAHGVSAPRLYWWRRRLRATAPAAEPRPEIRLAPATIVSTAATVELRLPNEIVVEVTGASPSWTAAMIVELTRAS
jgi:transposase-like protein